MKCPQCHTPVDDQAQFCSACGHDLQASPKQSMRWAPVYFGILAVIAVVLSLLALQKAQLSLRQQNKSIDIPSEQNEIATVPATSANLDQKTGALSTRKTPILIPLGTVRIEDITGRPISESIGAVIDNGWIAIPRSLGIGGFRWHMRLRDVGETPIEGGVFRDFDPVGLWQMASAVPVKGPYLKSWDENEPIDWFAVETGERLRDVEPRNCNDEGYIIHCDIPYGFSGPGVFFQKEHVVGWTFGEIAGGAFFWNGKDGQRLRIEVHLDDYYRLSFAEGREEKFLIAISDDMLTDIQRIASLIGAFQYPKKLSEAETPDRLRDETMTAIIRDGVRKAVSQGNGIPAINLFDRQVLLDIDEIETLLFVSQEAGKIHGAAEAVDMIEEVRD